MRSTILTVLLLSFAFTQASEAASIHCLPPGTDGVPEIKADVQSNEVLNNVSEAYVFDLGEMAPIELGQLVAVSSSSEYALRLFVLENDSQGKQYLLVPKDLAGMPLGSVFYAEYQTIDPTSKPGEKFERTLHCTLN